MSFNLGQVWKLNIPHEDIKATRLEDVRFAANLAEVAGGTAPSIYNETGEFFSKTFVTKALKNLLENVAARLNGEDVQSIWRLETFMGGGKTHALIALYHMARHRSIPSKEFPHIKVPVNTRVISFIGTNPDPSAITMWGEVAYKLGPPAYKKIKPSDESRTPPGVEKLKDILTGQPTLILIDEIAHYLEKAAAIPYADTTLARQTVVFLRELLDAASQLPQCVVVLTLTSTQEAYGERTQQVLDALREMQQITKRIATVEILTSEEELPGVVRRRLFAQWDTKAAVEIADAVLELYQNVEAIPDPFRTAAYHERILSSYPFHPELIDILTKRVASIQQFNRTRGMLRLLARVIRSVWQKASPDAYVILPCDVDLTDRDIRAELTKGLELHEFDAAIASDIANESGNSKSRLIDQSYLDKKLPSVATQLSNAIYLNTLIVGQKAGVDFGRLLVDVLVPGREPGWYETALETMVEDFWYLHHTGGLYFFYKEPTIAKIVQDEVGRINPNEVRGTIYKRAQFLYQRGNYFKAFVWPENPQTVPDDSSLKLVLLDYKTDPVAASSRDPPKQALDLWDNSARGPRVYRNTVFFLVADRTRVDRMNKVAREYLAVRNIRDRPETYGSLSDDQRKKLEQKQKQSELDFSISTADSYRFLFVPRNGGLSPVELQPKDIGDINIESNQRVIYEKLRNHHPSKIVEKLDPEYVISSAWPKGKGEVSTETLLDNFYQWSNLPLPQDINVIKETIIAGIDRKTWVYHYGRPYLARQPKPAVMFAPDATLYTVEEATKLNLCTSTGDPITEAVTAPPPPPPLTGDGEFLHAEDVASEAVERLRTEIKEKRLTKFTTMSLEIGGGKSEKAVGAILPLLREASRNIRIQFALKTLPSFTPRDAQISLDASMNLAPYEKAKQYLFQLAQISGEEPEMKVTLQWDEAPCDLPTLNKILDGIKDYNIDITLSIYGQR